MNEDTEGWKLRISIIDKDDIIDLRTVPKSRYPAMLLDAMERHAVRCFEYLLPLVIDKWIRERALFGAIIPPYHKKDEQARKRILDLIIAAGVDVNAVSEGGRPGTISVAAWNYDRVLTDNCTSKRLKWRLYCAERLIDAGADTSVLPKDHAFFDIIARRNARSARAALYRSLLLRTRLPKDVARLVVAQLRGQWNEWK